MNLRQLPTIPSCCPLIASRSYLLGWLQFRSLTRSSWPWLPQRSAIMLHGLSAPPSLTEQCGLPRNQDKPRSFGRSRDMDVHGRKALRAAGLFDPAVCVAVTYEARWHRGTPSAFRFIRFSREQRSIKELGTTDPHGKWIGPSWCAWRGRGNGLWSPILETIRRLPTPAPAAHCR